MEKELPIQVGLKNVVSADVNAGRGIMNLAADALLVKIARVAKIAKLADITK
jgi:hypothetical protein